MPLEDRKRMEPIDAFEAEDDSHVTYANIVPTTVVTTSDNSSGNNQPPQPVIYADLVSVQPPVVNADNNA